MRINSKLFTLFIAAADLTACQVEPATFFFEQSSALSASATYVTDTKAALVTAVPNTFSLYACSYSSTPTGVNYIYGETMTKSDSKWISVNKFRKVSSDKTVKYFAVYPSNATGLALPAADASGSPVFWYTLPADASIQSDIIVASHDYSGSQENITLSFGHILAAVDFKFSADGAFDGTIKSISVTGVSTKGSYTLGTGWGGLSTSGAVYQTLNKAVNEGMGGSAITTSSNAMLLMPQTAGSDAALEMVVNDGTKDITLTCSLSGEAFAAGKEYTIALDLSAVASSSLIIQSIDVTAWVNDATKYTLSEVFEYTKSLPAGEFSFPIMAFSPGLEVVVDWGDGTNEKFQMQSTQSGGSMALKHTYASSGQKTIRIYARGGTITFSDRYKTAEGNPYTILNNTVCQANIIGDYIKFSVEGTLQAPVAGGTNIIEVEATDNWTLTCPDWVTASPTSGGEGTTEVTLTVTKNASYEIRNGTVTGTLGVASADLSYSQYPVKLVKLVGINWTDYGNYGTIYLHNITNATERSLYSKVDAFAVKNGYDGESLTPTGSKGTGAGGKGGLAYYCTNISTDINIRTDTGRDDNYWYGYVGSEYYYCSTKVLGKKAAGQDGWKIPFLAADAPYADKLFGAGGGNGYTDSYYGSDPKPWYGGKDGGGNGGEYWYESSAAENGSFYGAGGGGAFLRGIGDEYWTHGGKGYIGCVVLQLYN